jgi:hypothetical protein
MQKRLAIRIFACSFIIMLVIDGCNTTSNKDYYWKGNDLYQKCCSSCHLIRNAENWVPPSLSNLANLDSTVLLVKLRKIKDDKIHKWLSNDLYPDYDQHLFYYIKHVNDNRAAR